MTISYALTASLVVALTVVPTAGSILLERTKEKRYPLFEKMQSAYGKLLAFCLRFKIIPLALAIVLLVICVREVLRMGITMLGRRRGDGRRDGRQQYVRYAGRGRCRRGGFFELFFFYPA